MLGIGDLSIYPYRPASRQNQSSTMRLPARQSSVTIWTMKSFLRGFFSVVLLLVCASCASSKRMTRISPFGEMTRQAQLDRDRINAWPLVYHQRDTTSLLWPIVDIDDRGFAIRPLLNVEDQVWSVLFPLSSYSFDRKVGWFLTAYKYEDYLGVFPLFHKGDDIDSI